MRQRLGDHRAAGDDVGGVDIGAHGALRVSVGQEPLQGVVDASPRVDGGGVGQGRRATQGEYQLVPQPKTFLQIGLHRRGSGQPGFGDAVECCQEQTVGAVFQSVQ